MKSYAGYLNLIQSNSNYGNNGDSQDAQRLLEHSDKLKFETEKLN